MVVIEENDPPMVDAILVEEEPRFHVVGATSASLSGTFPTAVAIGSGGETTSGTQSTLNRTMPGSQGRRVASPPQTYQGGSFVATTTYYLPVTQAESETFSLRPNLGLGRYPCRIQCPYCNQETLTKTRDRIDAFTICMTITLFFLFWPLFWLPLVCPSCKTTEHYCEHCDVVVGESSDHCQCCR